MLSFCEGHRQVKCFSDVYKGSHEYSGLKKTLKCKSPSDKKEGYFLLQYAQGLVHLTSALNVLHFVLLLKNYKTLSAEAAEHFET